MTKLVLFVGCIFAGLLTLGWVVFEVLPSLPNTGFAPFDHVLQILRYFEAIHRWHYPNGFSVTRPLFELWFWCLLGAVVHDGFVKPPARAVASAFAAALSPDDGQTVCRVWQGSTWTGEIQTTTSGSFRGRHTTVLIDFYYGKTTISSLTLEMACNALWTLDVKNRNLLSRALAAFGTPLETGDKALDEAVVIQGDAEAAIRQWTRLAGVHPRILSLFQAHKITSLTSEIGSEGEPVLRVYCDRFRPRFFPSERAIGILDDVAELAATAEAARANP